MAAGAAQIAPPRQVGTAGLVIVRPGCDAAGMRPLTLTLSGLRSYSARRTIDFRDIDLMAVVGDTGAGKSSILEAICFALYGTASWSGRAVKDLVAHSADVMEVSLCFLAKGHEWTVYRSAPKGTHPPARRKLSCEALGVELDGKKDVEEKIYDLIGLSYDAFLRCVILPQGRFQELLRASDTERSKLLKGVFQLDVIERVSGWADERLREREPQLATLRGRRDGLPADPAAEAEAAARERDQLTVEREALAKVSAACDEAEEEAEAAGAGASAVVAATAAATDTALAKVSTNLTALGALEAEIDAGLAEVAEARARHEGEREGVTQALAQAKEQGFDAGGLARAGKDVREVREILDRVDERFTAIESEVAAAQQARAAYTAAEDEVGAKRAALDAAQQAEVEAQLQAQRAEVEAKLQAQRADMAAHLRAELVAGDACPVCGQDVPAQTEIAQARGGGQAGKQVEATVKQAEAAVKKAEAAAKKAAAAAKKAKAALKKAETAEKKAAEAGKKAEAAVERSRAKSDASVDTLRARVAGLPAALSDAPWPVAADAGVGEGTGADGAAEMPPGLAALAAARAPAQAWLDDAEAAIEARRASLEVAEERAAALDRELKACAKQQQQLERRRTQEVERVLDRARDAVARAHRAGVALAAALATPEGESDTGTDASADLQLAVEEPPEESTLAELAEFAQALDTELARLVEIGAGRREVLRERERGARERAKELLDEHGYASAKALAEARGGVAVKIDAAEDRRRLAAAQVEPLRLLDERIAQGGAYLAGLRELKRVLAPGQLLKYAVGRKQEALLTVASRLLGEMSAGRFGFGEEFTVVDRHAGEARAVETLSGGETFLASLALALALIELAGRAGGRLDALFLDEGFGSLDADALDLAVEALIEQSKRGRLVAVISHVRAVAESIEDVLHVRVTPTGSDAVWLNPDARRELALDDGAAP